MPNISMTLEDLNREEETAYLLDPPAPLVVKRLCTELRKYMEFTKALKKETCWSAIELYELYKEYEIKP